MRIDGLRVDGFGLLAGLEIGDLPPGLTIVVGPNEAGKSTLLDFLRGVLFGFPDRRRREPYHEPLRGGRHGGALCLVDANGATWHLERHLGDRQPVLTMPDGSLGSDGDLQRLLGGADETLFRSVFAFGLGELSNFDTLDREEIRDLVFSAGILGAGGSATRAARSLESRRVAIVRPRQGEARTRGLRARHGELEARLRAARFGAESYPDAAAALAQLAFELDEARDLASQAHRRATELERLAACWPTWRRRQEAIEELDALSDEEEPDALDALAPEIERLSSELSGHLERRRSATSLSGQRQSIARKIEAVLEDLDRGGDLQNVLNLEVGLATRDRVAALVESDRALQAELRSLELTYRRSGEEADESSAFLKQCEVDAPPDFEDASTELRELRALLAEHDRRMAEQSVARTEAALADLARGTASQRSDPPTQLVAGVLGGVALLIAAVAIWRHANTLAFGCLGVVLVVLVFTLAGRAGRTPDRTDTDQPANARHGELGRLTAEIAERARSLGLSEQPLLAELDALAEQHQRAREQWRIVDEARRVAAVAQRRQAVAHQHLEEGRAARRDLERSVATVAAALGLGAITRPEALVEAVAKIGEVQQLAGAAERVDAELESLAEAVTDFEEALANVAAVAGIAPAETEAITVGRLSEAVRECTTKMKRRRSLEEAVATAEADLGESLGGGAEAKRLSDELAGGEVVAWEEERRRLTAELPLYNSEVENRVARHAAAARQLQELVGSGEVAELELELEAVASELDEALEEWLTLGAARSLLERTLARYEHDRQPAVIASATDLFSQITEGRYVRLIAREDPDNSARHGITAVTAAGERVEAGDLSRGTAEQLYLCLRLAFATTFAERAVSLPLVLDDVLVNFDPARAAAVARTVATVSLDHQVIAFTCHPHVAEHFCQATGGVRVVTLPETA